jgi:hypothetical protein
MFIISCNHEDKKKISDNDTLSIDEFTSKYKKYESSVNVPISLTDCFKELDKILPDSTRNKIKSKSEENFSSDAHFGLGLWIRNYWIRKDNKLLRDYFNKLGIFHPDDMSGIILDSYHRYLNKKEIKLEEQIKSYKEYWEVTLLPDKSTYPKDAKFFLFNLSYNYSPKNFKYGCVHVGSSPKSKIFWLFDYRLGWTKASKEDINKIEINIINREMILKAIYKKNQNFHFEI